MRIAHERGALVLLDAYQSAGTVPLDVNGLGADVVAAGTSSTCSVRPGSRSSSCDVG